MKINKKGFTLMELLVVVAIIGILATVIISNLGKARQKSKDAAITAEMNQILTAIELETDGLGVYTDVCNLFQSGGNLEKFITAIEKNGGEWEDCENDDVSYSILVTLNTGGYAFNIAQKVYAAESKTVTARIKGVHSSENDEPILFKEEDLKKLRSIVGKNYKIKKPQYYCVGMQPATQNRESVMKGYMYDVARGNFTGCGVLLENKFDADILLAAIENGLIEDTSTEDRIEIIERELQKLEKQIEEAKDDKEREALIETHKALEREHEKLSNQ